MGEEPAPSAPEKESRRFLIVDDHAVVRRGVRELLREHFPSAVFAEAGTAQDALELAWREPWDVIILDISMPGRSGLDILRDLAQANRQARVLVQSIYSEDQFAQRVLKAGAAGYITKESLAGELLRAVTRVMAGGFYVSLSLAEKLAGSLNHPGRAPHETLSDREFSVFLMLARGDAPKEISTRLLLSTKTISTYRSRVMAKLGLHTNAELVQYALRTGLLE